VEFHDAVLVLSNPAAEPAEAVVVHLRVQQGGTTLMEGPLDLPALGVETSLAPGQAARLSLFRALQHHVRGFGSKVNLFGYKAVLNWAFRVEASIRSGAGGRGEGAWDLEWRPAEGNPGRVEVGITPG
jgi:hypothetical protein